MIESTTASVHPRPAAEARPRTTTDESRFRLRLAASDLTLRRPADQPGRIARALRRAMIDLNPHQVEAAVIALAALSEDGVILADEVGLGKTIEAGLVLAQMVAEGRERLLVLTPASLRKQWQRELDEKLGLRSTIVDGNTKGALFDRPREIVIASHPFAARRAAELQALRWDVAIIDEAHRLRGAHKGSKTASALRAALHRRPKVLLTATPMQNGLAELYGLLSFLDPDLLGSFEQFRRAFPEDLPGQSAQDLRERVQPYVHRTLRRQVKEYVRYTERKSIVCEFTPTPDEAKLYEEVSAYLADPETIAIDPARRHLMVMVYRKLLASSPAAIAGTLNQLALTLASRLERGDVDPEPDADAKELLRQLEEEAQIEGQEPPETRPRSPATPSRMQGEIDHLMGLTKLARSIRRPAKMGALLAAIDRAFTEAISRGWPQKAVVFTESRRTQDALVEALEEAGHRGFVEIMNGESGDAEKRAGIVDRFRDSARILILTEAGAEGLNLQFANLVVNYDLPWNPQRIEQRIGRCHRYGQTRDVVVLNFLASENEAEARLYDLLSEKLSLFDGVFGTTDDVLGSVGDGATFERRVHDIFSECRDESAIRAAFDQLQAQLGDQIAGKMATARAQICDHFDDEIRERLRMTGAETAQALAKDEASLLTLVKGGIPGAVIDENGHLHLGDQVIEISRNSRTRDGDFLTVDHPIAARLIQDLSKEPADEVRYTSFEYTAGAHKISRLAPLVGGEGWWLAYRASFDGPLSEDHLVHVVIMRSPDGETVFLDQQQIDAMLSIHTRDIEKRPRLKAATLASRHAEQLLEPQLIVLMANMEDKAAAERKRLRHLTDLGFDDRLRAIASGTASAELAWKKAREMPSREESERLFRELVKSMDRETEERTRAVTWRKERLAELNVKGPLEMTRSLLATTYFWLD